MAKKSKAAPKKIKATKTEPLTAHIILDRSGSMASNWPATIAGVNAYVADLAKEGIKGTVSLTVFDAAHGSLDFNGIPYYPGRFPIASRSYAPAIDVVRTNVAISEWAKVSADEVSPRGFTPLRDAVGKTLTAMRGQKIKGKVAVVVMTDGLENASQEFTAEAVAALLKACEADGWLITYLGANHNSWDQAKDLGFRAGTVADFSEQAVGATFGSTSSLTQSYLRASGAQASHISYSDSDRARMKAKT